MVLAHAHGPHMRTAAAGRVGLLCPTELEFRLMVGTVLHFRSARDTSELTLRCLREVVTRGERRRRMRMCWVAASRRRGTGPRPPDQIADLDGVVNSLVYLIVSDVEPREVSTHGE